MKLKHLDFVYVKQYKGCQWGLSRCFHKDHDTIQEQKIAEGYCLDEKGEPMQFSVVLQHKSHFDDDCKIGGKCGLTEWRWTNDSNYR